MSTTCQRCSIHHATTSVSGLPMCTTCASQLQWRYGASAPQVGASITDPYGMGQELGQSLKSGNGGGLGTISNAASAVKEGASSIKTTAIVVGLLTGAAILYVVYKQAQNARAVQDNAFQLFREHPEALHAVTHV